MRRAVHSFRGVLLSACLIVCDVETSEHGVQGPSWAVASQKGSIIHPEVSTPRKLKSTTGYNLKPPTSLYRFTSFRVNLQRTFIPKLRGLVIYRSCENSTVITYF